MRSSWPTIALPSVLAVSILAPSGCGLTSSGCSSAEDSCEHFRHKSFSPRNTKALSMCTEACREDDFAAGCDQAYRWYMRLERWDEAREMALAGCALAGDETCPRAKDVDSSRESAAYNQEAEALRQRMGACASDPEPCVARCDYGDIDACVQLADMYSRPGRGVDEDLERAQQYFERACERHDDTRYCSRMFEVYPECRVSEVPGLCDDDMVGECPPSRRVDPNCKKIARQGDLSVETHLRICNGQRACDAALRYSCERDPDACQSACDTRQDAARCRELADMFESGRGRPQDAQEATRYRERACQLGDTVSCAKVPRGTARRRLKPRLLLAP